MSLPTMIQKLVEPTELSFASIPRPRSLLLLSLGELPSPYVLRLISKSRIWNTGVSLSLPILPILHLFCLCLKQMARTVSAPTVRECLNSLHGSTLFTSLDLYSGYWQIPIAKEHCHKTAYSTESGHWQFFVLPFGVKNAPAVFARLMADIMNGLQWNGIAI